MKSGVPHSWGDRFENVFLISALQLALVVEADIPAHGVQSCASIGQMLTPQCRTCYDVISMCQDPPLSNGVR